MKEMLLPVLITLSAITASSAQSFGSPPLDWVDKDESGAYRFGYATGDEGKHYHVVSASARNMVSGRFGYKDPVTGGDLQTVYTSGRKGFRARGPHIARRMDLSQNKPPFSRPNNDGKYIPELDNVFDPNEDRGFDFSYRTATQIKEEHADRAGDVQGRYSYIDDVGNRHTVEYVAGANTGFLVTNAVPDTFARARGGPLYFVGNRPGPKIRGFHAVQKTLDGSYRFEASGPDHKRSEVSDALGNRRGVYTYLDDKGMQHTVEYIAGPKIGYKIINNKRGTSYNPVLPFFPDSPTAGPFAPTFPTTTQRPIGSLSSLGGSVSRPKTTLSPSPNPSDSTKIPVVPTGITPSFPEQRPSGSPGSLPGSNSPSSSGFPDPSYSFAMQSSTPSSILPTGSSHLSNPVTESAASSSVSDTSTSNFDVSDQKWDYNYDHGFGSPLFSSSKNWSTHTKHDSKSKPQSSTSSDFPFFKPSFPEDVESATLFESGLSTAESKAGLKPPFRPECLENSTTTDEAETQPGTPRSTKSHYRGSIKFGGIRRSGYSKGKREEFLEIPPGVAVRAHVQSLDIVPLDERFASPGEALKAFSKGKNDRL